MKLSRRDRAAMTLALECVRESRCGLNEASRALGIGDADSRFLREAMGHNWYGHVDRVRRARLALALRVLLRCDRGRDDLGDFGPRVGRVVQPGTCITCGGAGPLTYTTVRGEACSSVCASLARRILPRRSIAIRPLWESAPPHEVSR